MKPLPAKLREARADYDLGADFFADIKVVASRGRDLIPAFVKDEIAEICATRCWFELRRGGWSAEKIALVLIREEDFYGVHAHPIV
jgi:hypothetical protein